MLCRRWSHRNGASGLVVSIVPVHWLENGEISWAGVRCSGEKSHSSVGQALNGTSVSQLVGSGLLRARA